MDENKEQLLDKQFVVEEADIVPDELTHRTIVVENDKLFLSGSIKLGLKNYSNVTMDFGITHVLGSKEDTNEVADKLFNEQIVPKLKEFVGKLASIGTAMINVIEGMENTNKKFIG